ncbi:MAG: Hsp20/alpha crystallin family protein [Alphaproteobacteria bacterium]
MMVEKTNTPAWWPSVYEPFRHFGERIADWFAPRAEAKASNAHYEITMELPGVTGNDIEVSLHEGVLTVKGEKRSEREEEGEGYFFSEREYGRFQRTFRLPADAKGDDVVADFSIGVLKITVEKLAEEKAQVKKIKVNAL